MTSELFSPAPSGVLVIDKPPGPTSHDVVARVRRALRTRAVGHAGTLDPMASGVLVVAVGEATKLVAWLTAHDKTYEATVALGVATDTLDAEGREVLRRPIDVELARALARSTASNVDPRIEAALGAERARKEQVPPAFSAIKVDGQRSFARARSGKAPVLAARPVRVDHLDLEGCEVDPPSVSVSLAAGKGYYVRAFARDFADRLGTCGHLTRLRRTRSGPFSAGEAVPPDASADVLRAHLQPTSDAATRALPAARLSDAGVLDAKHGRAVRACDIASGASGPCAWLDARGALVGVGETQPDGRGRILRGFTG